MILLCLLAIFVGGVAAGCAGDESGGGAANTPSPTPVPAPSIPVPTASKPSAGPTVTLVGEVKAGVEAGCLVLEAEGGGSWLLLDGDRSVLRAGARVQVTGAEATGVVTTCQQGRPFTVRTARPA